MPTKLSLVHDQTAPDNFWNPYDGNPYGDEALGNIKDNIGDLEIPVTSIPSPFAQLHLFDTAFNSVNEEFKKTRNPQALSGNSTYHKLISDCLDVYELLYLYDELKLEGSLKIATWDYNSRINALKESTNPGLRTFADVLQLFINNYNIEKKFVNSGIEKPFNSFTIILYNNNVIAGTSPLTGFFTTGNPINEHIKNLDNRMLFRTKTPLYKRDPGFQKFMNVFFQKFPKTIQAFTSVHKYIELNRDLIQDQAVKNEINQISVSESPDISEFDILYVENNPIDVLPSVQYYYKKVEVKEQINEIRNSDYVIRSSRHLTNPPLALMPGLQNNNWIYLRNALSDDITIPDYSPIPIDDRTIPGFDTLKYPFLLRNDLLSKHIIQLDYKINDDRFWSCEESGDQNSFLLPIKPEYFKYFSISDLKEHLNVYRLETGGIVVRLEIPVQGDSGRGMILFDRTYNDVNPANIEDENKGAIINAQLYMGIYPFFKVSDPVYNDFYKICLFYNPDRRINCSLYKDGGDDGISLVPITDTTVRTRAEERLGVISKYLEISKDAKDSSVDITFDIIGIKVEVENLDVEGIILPEMHEDINLVDQPSVIAYDIGTSNTFVSCSIKGGPEKLTTYRDFESGEGMHYVMLHKPERDNDVFKGSEQFDLNSKIGNAYQTLQLNEFLPSLIGDESDYTLPMRTIINQDNDTNANHESNVKVLSNVNIPFAFGKIGMRNTFDNAYSNLKWGISDQKNKSSANRLKAFIEQLVIMGRNKILSEGYNPKLTNVLWFKPLSMSNNQIMQFNRIWEELYIKHFSKSASDLERLTNITESWAPFYSYQKTFGAGESYLNIDIGGGTTDILIFKDNQPKLTASFRFAGNSLFDDGPQFVDAGEKGENRKDNGFVVKYCDIMEKNFKDNNDLEKLEILQYLKSSPELSSEDLISFFFTMKEFSESLQLDTDFMLLFLLHNVSIFYHSAQILRNYKEAKIPNYIGLSGNGAKLLEIANKSKNMNRPKGMAYLVNHIFKKVFGLDEAPKIEIQILDNPKESTSIGGIKGLSQIQKNPTADTDNFYIPVGDEETIIWKDDTATKRKYQYSAIREEGNPVIASVAENYLNFIEFFFDELWFDCDLANNFGVDRSFNPEKLKEYFSNEENVRNVIRSTVVHKIDVEQELLIHESMFFYPIRAFLYDFSKILASDTAINNYKGH